MPYYTEKQIEHARSIDLLTYLQTYEVLPYGLEKLLLSSLIIFSVAAFTQTLIGFLRSWIMLYLSQRIDIPLMLGSLMAFMTLTGYFMEPVGSLVGLQLDIQEAQISMKRITEILDYDREEPEEQDEVNRECNLKGDIQIENVSFRYGNRNLALDNVSFTIERGKKTALVGASGSGKSTIVKLLLKYYEPEHGRIKIGGKDIAEVSAKYLRENISLVPQNIQLFSKSIYENVAMVKPNASQSEVAKALAMADAQDFIRKQPMQAFTYLEEAGQGLSGGERQRLALARAFLKDSDVFILDESTSNLDFGTENVIFDTIYNKLPDRTMLIVAHRLSTIKNCDKIIVLDDGKVIEEGTHAELIAMQGAYDRLWQLQQGNISTTNNSIDMHEQTEELAVSADADDNTITYT